MVDFYGITESHTGHYPCLSVGEDVHIREKRKVLGRPNSFLWSAISKNSRLSQESHPFFYTTLHRDTESTLLVTAESTRRKVDS